MFEYAIKMSLVYRRDRLMAETYNLPSNIAVIGNIRTQTFSIQSGRPQNTLPSLFYALRSTLRPTPPKPKNPNPFRVAFVGAGYQCMHGDHTIP